MVSGAAFIVAISGCSSSGKTTLARILRDIFPFTYIVHEDDFYKPDDQIPIKKGIQDWDCAGAIDIPTLSKTLSHIHQTGELPASHASKEDQNETGPSNFPPELLEAYKCDVRDWCVFGPGTGLLGERKRLVLLEGFLLYSPAFDDIQDHLDKKLFLRTTLATLKARRENRKGYVTLEGFWEDPPGYVDDIVWPNYVADHAFLFQEDLVEGQINTSVAMEHGIEVAPGKGGEGMEEVVAWAVNVLKQGLIDRAALEIGLKGERREGMEMAELEQMIGRPNGHQQDGK